MSFGSSFDTKQQVKDAIDIVDLVGSYTQLRADGRAFKALCPWHDDTRPSLQVNRERQSFKCWVCDIGGDIFSFVMKMEGITFPEALAMLAERAGIRLEARDEQASRPASPADDKRLLYKAMAWAVEQYHQFLLQDGAAAVARDYVALRTISPQSVRQFQLGFAPNEWDWILQRSRSTPYVPAMLERVGLVKRRTGGPGYYDCFRGRVLFPILDVQNRPVALGGRVLPEFAADDSPKYYNSPETPLFSKSKMLYGLNIARGAVRKTGTALVMEGYTDCVAAHQHGFDNAVAVLGTALGAKQIALLQSFAERMRIVLVLDGDEAGRRRANDILELFVSENANLRVLTLPDDLDPCEFLLQRGAPAFGDLVENSIDALEHAFRAKTVGIDLQKDIHESSQALEQLLATIAKAPRLRGDTTTEDRLREEKFLQRLALDFRVSEDEVRTRLTQLRRKPAATRQQPIAAPQPATATAEKIDPYERELLELLLRFPQAIERASQSVQPEDFGFAPARAIYERCQELALRQVTADFARLLLEFDDPVVKTLLVELEEHARLKGQIELEETLQDVLTGFLRRQQQPLRRAQTLALRQHQLQEDEELAILLEIEQQERSRQGISGPMDG